MASPEFYPETMEGKLDHVVEECAKVILVASKYKRFGCIARTFFSIEGSGVVEHIYNNEADLLNEIQDAIAAMRRFVVTLSESSMPT